MQEITMFVLKNCPYCRQAQKDLDALLADPRYRDIRASRVRECSRAGGIDQTRAMVPETTYAFLKNHFGADAPCP